MAHQGVSFSDQVRALARALGFEAVGITRANVPLDTDYSRYLAFVGDGLHGDMAWLARDAALRERLDGDGILMGAKSVVCVARRYPNEARASTEDGDALSGIARYARGRDYHRFLRRRLRRLATFLRSLGTAERPVHARPLCDEEPVLERAWAVRAGLGFVGKNGLLIAPGLGSMVLLGEVVTTLELEPDRPLPRVEERCGSCTRCLDACPTHAFRAPFVLDPRRCISYLTIEQRGLVPEPLREPIGTHLFGCDDCQTVCPFNAGMAARSPLDRTDGDPFAPLERWSRLRLESLLALDPAEWRALFEGTPLRRIGRAGVARNAAMVLGNLGDAAALPALRRAAADHDDAVVRETAAWAASRLEGA